jgi:hypothetical protein
LGDWEAFFETLAHHTHSLAHKGLLVRNGLGTKSVKPIREGFKSGPVILFGKGLLGLPPGILLIRLQPGWKTSKAVFFLIKEAK